MALTEKISVAMGRRELRLARQAANDEGLSLSAFVTSAVRARIAEKHRLDAARQLIATFAPDEFPTPEIEAELLALWSAPRPSSGPRPARPPRARKRR